MTEQIPRVFMTLESFFCGIRCQGGKFTSTQWKIEADIFALKKDGEDDEDVVDMATVKWQALNFWIGLLDDVIVFDINDDWALSSVKIVLPNNPVMTLPAFPSDDMIAAAIAEKINTIADGHLYCSRVMVRSEEVGVKYTVLVDENETILPGVEYAGDNTHEDVPWWKRHDSQTFDINMESDEEDDTNVTELRSNNTSDILIQFEQQVAEQLQGIDDPSCTVEIIFDQDENFFFNSESSDDEDSSNIIEPEWDQDK